MSGYSDERTRAALERIDEEQRQEERRAIDAEVDHMMQARRELEEEVEHRLLAWMSHGGDPSSFPGQDVRREILLERQREHARKQQASSVF
ncbi:MAG: hypothetical protein M3R38_12755 [Actinomycetota bacterium]|nr:hypothetical protein [Actinomycetota bacterium]